MPTSATGARPAAERGFTLIELMVTLFIIGLMAGAVVLTLPNGEPRLDRDAERFAARLKRAREEAVLTNRSVEVRLDARGYGFRTERRGRWSDLDAAPFTAQAWSEGVRMAVKSADGDPRVRFDATGAAGAAQVELARDRYRLVVRVDTAGNVTVDAPAG